MADLAPLIAAGTALALTVAVAVSTPAPAGRASQATTATAGQGAGGAAHTGAGAAVGTGPAPDQGNVAFVDAGVPAASVDSKGKLTVTMFVINTTPTAMEARLGFALRSVRGSGVTPSALDASWTCVETGGVLTAITATADVSNLKGDAFPLSGFLTLDSRAHGQTATSTVKTLPISAIERTNDGAEWPLLYAAAKWTVVPIGLAALLLLLTDARALTVRIGSPKWSFADSWSSTITLAGTILTGLMSFAGIPNYGPTMNKTTYVIASVLCSTLILLAPGVFNLFRKTSTVKDATGIDVQQTQGLVPFFMAAAVLTTTGVVAQLRLLDVLFSDLGAVDIISTHTAVAFGYLCRALQVVLLVYAGVSTFLTVKEQAEMQKPAGNDKAVANRQGKPQKLPDWALL